MSDEADRKFLFEYRFGGHEWMMEIFAKDPAEAKEKIKAASMARYLGESHLTIYVPCFIDRLVAWWRS